MAKIRSKPSTPNALAINTSAIPPTLRRSSSRYLPNGLGFFIESRRNRRTQAHQWISDTNPSRTMFFQQSRVFGQEIKKAPTRLSQSGGIISGNDLLSRAVSRGVPSALEGLTAVFEMGTGVTPPKWSPEILSKVSHEASSIQVMNRILSICSLKQGSRSQSRTALRPPM